jgi:hypothetical protein
LALLKFKTPEPLSITPNCLIRISITASGSLATALAFNFLKEIFTEPLIVPPFLADIHTGVRASMTIFDLSPLAISRIAWIMSNSLTVSTDAGANG